MSKKNLAKRLIALVAIVAMFAAMTITASAAEFSSTTMYVGNDTVKVKTYVTGLEKGDEVTYYAKTTENDVYVNQYTANGSTLEKEYVADLDKIDGMEIKMTKVDADFSNPATIEEAANIGAFTFVLNDAVVYDAKVAPAVDDIVETTIPVINEGKMISTVSATYGDVKYDFPVVIIENKVAIVNPIDFGEGTDMKYVELTAAYDAIPEIETVTITYIGVQTADEYKVDDVTGTLFAVAYDIDSAVAPTEFGIEILGEETQVLPAIGASAEGKFAIAVVDEDFAPFKYRSYVVVGDNTVYGDVKTANIK